MENHLKNIIESLDRELKIAEFKDISHNGLQVARRDQIVNKVCCGVDASLEFFQAAHERGADLLICHHGISWGGSLSLITELNYRQVSFLMEHDMALWACHLPLDAHATLGNNAGIARALALENVESFGEYGGQSIGFAGSFPNPVGVEQLHALLEGEFANKVHALPFGKDRISTVGIISGGAADEVVQAASCGLDAFITGEPSLVGYNLAKQLGINVFFGGHYATERYGVRSLGVWLAEKFDIEQEFIDFSIQF